MFINGRETGVQSQVESYQRLKKWYLIPLCLTLSIIRYGSRVKWSNPGKGVSPSPTPWCSSYWKGNLRRPMSPTLFYIYICVCVCVCVCVSDEALLVSHDVNAPEKGMNPVIPLLQPLNSPIYIVSFTLALKFIKLTYFVLVWARRPFEKTKRQVLWWK